MRDDIAIWQGKMVMGDNTRDSDGRWCKMTGGDGSAQDGYTVQHGGQLGVR